MLAGQNKFPRHRSQEIVVQKYDESAHDIADDDEILATCNKASAVKIVFSPQAVQTLTSWIFAFFMQSVPSKPKKCYKY